MKAEKCVAIPSQVPPATAIAGAAIDPVLTNPGPGAPENAGTPS